MPELPEVETVVRDLRPLLVGRIFTKIEVGKKALRRKWSAAWNTRIIGTSVHAVNRRGKWILLDLAGPWLLVHLGMTGQFTVVPASKARESHTHLVFTLDNESELRFRDVRRFGSATLVPDRATLDAFFTQSALGPEPFDIDAKVFHASIRHIRRNLKAILLDQTIVAGVGNIYADESLFEAKLHPTRLGNEITRKQAETLHNAIVRVLNHAIEKRGATISDYVDGTGRKGQFQTEFRAYGRTGEPCMACDTPIEKITLAGRSTHFCPRCQRKRT